MKTSDRCILCGASNFKNTDRCKAYSITKGSRTFTGHIASCTTCGLSLLPAQFVSSGNHYVEAIDPEYALQSTQRFINVSRLLASLKGLKLGSKLLDIGCSCGFVLKVSRDQFGLEVHGVWPSRWDVEYARQNFALILQNGFIETMNFLDNFLMWS
jgi:Mycolic acid cyclopropane synthetase